MKWWKAGDLEVLGPYRDPATGRVTAMSGREQRRWAARVGGRRPTASDFDAIWQHADVRVPPNPRDVATAPLDALHDDVVEALDGSCSDRIAAGKTWLDSGANYGWLVPAAMVTAGARSPTWRGIRVYPTSLPDAYAIQPVGHAHGPDHVDYSQLGYAVREVEVEDTEPDTPKPVTKRETPASLRRDDLIPLRRTLRLQRPMMQGEDVQVVQLAVGAKPDGWYGPATARAVRRWQRASDLVVDGVVGPMTWAALDAAPPVAIEPPPPQPTRPEGYDLIRATNYRWGTRRAVGDVHMPTIHTIQCPPRAGFARRNAQWFAGARAPNASIHWWVGPDETVQGLEERHLAWGAKSGPERHAQLYAIHVEHTGYTADPYRDIPATDWEGEGAAVIEAGARLMADICARWDIQPERVDAERLSAWRDAIRAGDHETAWALRGITDHAAWTDAYSVRGGHRDVGSTWPWERYLELVRDAMPG